MIYEQVVQLIGALESLATVLALLIGGFWTYRRFIRQRKGYPLIEFCVDINFVGCKDEYWVVELTATLENKGRARQEIREIDFELDAILSDDPIQISNKFKGQVFFPHKIAKGTWLSSGWDYTFVEPGIKTRYTHVTRVPTNATFLILHSWFDYPKSKWYKFKATKESHSTEKTMAVPSHGSQRNGELNHPGFAGDSK